MANNDAAGANGVAANGATSANAGDAKKAIQDAEAGSLAAFRAKDAAKVASYYDKDAMAAIPGRKMDGMDAIKKGQAEDLADPTFKLDFKNDKTEVAASGDLGYTRGTFDVTFTDKATKQVKSQKGLYLTVYRKQADGSWKMVEDFATPTG